MVLFSAPTGSQVLNLPSENSPAMAMPDLVQSVANSFLELTPGTSANPANLKTLLDYLQSMYWSKTSTDGELRATMQSIGLSKKKTLRASLDGPERTYTMPSGTYTNRSNIVLRTFPMTKDGLLEAIVLLKKSIQKYRTEGTCEACQPPTKRLKADGMPKCENCMLSVTIGITGQRSCSTES